ncbi:hypothetical protein BD410DRAFT_792020 [Rickenella mellea]|uniref:Uncharacterized protein n=1 Tax=Rickenella mellea TaxID=50990 RepID=A0A4Y7PW56_9AGAM|nr:hypothetical protein BD410DRAFT_792020 [Rickenella mellea]
MSVLLRSLKAMPKLQKLSLTFRHVVLGVDLSDLSVVVLPLVESFTFVLEGGLNVERIMNVLFRNLKLPNVVELSLHLAERDLPGALACTLFSLAVASRF